MFASNAIKSLCVFCTDEFFVRLGIPTEVRLKIMEVLDTDNAGVLRREQIVRRFVEIYERRRDLAKSLASTTSVLATLERTTPKSGPEIVFD